MQLRTDSSTALDEWRLSKCHGYEMEEGKRTRVVGSNSKTQMEGVNSVGNNENENRVVD